jgi:cell division protein FtsI (penicillin-binding protein 3)
MSDTHRNSRQFRDRSARAVSNFGRERKSSLVGEAALQEHRQSLAKTRLTIVWGGLGLGALGLVARLVWLQVIDAPNLQQQARAQQRTTERPFVPRRPIVDRTGSQLAIDRPSYTLYAHPVQFRETERIKRQGKRTEISVKPVATTEMAQRLAPILGIGADRLLALLSQRPTGVKLGTGLREDTASRIRALKVDGLDLRQGKDDYTRVYPQDKMAAEVLGYLDTDRIAQAGVERSKSALLKRKVTEYQLTQTAKGAILPDRVTPDFLHTDDLKLKLTIDLRLQRAARQALHQKRTEWHARRGTVIVMEAETGAIRALVVEPTYNPNDYHKDIAVYGGLVGKNKQMSLLQNWAVSDLYEPGSTFKPLAVAIALENGIITPNSTFYDGGLITVNQHPIRNADLKANGTIDVAQILQYSSNVGMVKMMQRLQPDIFYNWLQRIGLGQTSGIDLPLEAQGTLVSRKEFVRDPIYPANTAFGQGISLTPMQLTAAIATLANGGKSVAPYVVEGLFDSTGVRKDSPTRPEPKQIFSPATAKSVMAMMETVVTKGSGVKAQIEGYRIAGKTGTSQKSNEGKGGYSDKKVTSFVGIIPVDADRHFVVFAAVDEPYKQGDRAFGSNVAAPIVKSVMEALISIEGIPPSTPIAPLPTGEVNFEEF